MEKSKYIRYTISGIFSFQCAFVLRHRRYERSSSFDTRANVESSLPPLYQKGGLCYINRQQDMHKENYAEIVLMDKISFTEFIGYESTDTDTRSALNRQAKAPNDLGVEGLE